MKKFVVTCEDHTYPLEGTIYSYLFSTTSYSKAVKQAQRVVKEHIWAALKNIFEEQGHVVIKPGENLKTKVWEDHTILMSRLEDDFVAYHVQEGAGKRSALVMGTDSTHNIWITVTIELEKQLKG